MKIVLNTVLNIAFSLGLMALINMAIERATGEPLFALRDALAVAGIHVALSAGYVLYQNWKRGQADAKR